MNYIFKIVGVCLSFFFLFFLNHLFLPNLNVYALPNCDSCGSCGCEQTGPSSYACEPCPQADEPIPPDEWTCFAAGTKVIMASNQSKNIEDVVVGDKVISQDEWGKRSVSTVVKLDQPIRDHMCKVDFVEGHELNMTTEHPVMTDEGWKSIKPDKTAEENPDLIVGTLETGDRVIRQDGEYAKIKNITCQSKKTPAYNLILDGAAHTYFADGYLAHNKGGGSTCPAGTERHCGTDEPGQGYVCYDGTGGNVTSWCDNLFPTRVVSAPSCAGGYKCMKNCTCCPTGQERTTGATYNTSSWSYAVGDNNEGGSYPTYEYHCNSTNDEYLSSTKSSWWWNSSAEAYYITQYNTCRVASCVFSPPTNLTASCPAPGTTANLSWSNTGASYYTVKVDDLVDHGGVPWWTCTSPDFCADIFATSWSPSYPTKPITPTHTYSWKVFAVTSGGLLSNPSYGQNFTCTPSAPTCTIYADNQTVAYNGSTTVRWSSTNATGCSVAPYSTTWTGTSGAKSTGTMTSTTTYTATCPGTGGGNATCSTQVVVSAPTAPTCTMTLSGDDPISIASGTSTQVVAHITNMTGVPISGEASSDPTNKVTISLDSYTVVAGGLDVNTTVTGVSGGQALITATVTLFGGWGIPNGNCTATKQVIVPVNGGWTDWTPALNPLCGYTNNQTRTCTDPAPYPTGVGLECTNPDNPNFDGDDGSRSITNPPCPPPSWWQVKDGDVTTDGDLTSKVPTSQYFDTNGSGGYHGVPVFGGTFNLTSDQAKLLAPKWNAETTTFQPRRFDYSYFKNLIPDSITLTDPSVTPLTTDVTDQDGYDWYKSTGDLTITSDINFGNRKVILFVDGGNLTINGKINVNDGVAGSGFFATFVNGNINVSPSISDTPTLEGIYLSDGAFNTSFGSVGTSQLHVRGSVVSYGTISLQRDLADDSIDPSELFEFAPDQIMLFPEKLGYRGQRWAEVAP